MNNEELFNAIDDINEKYITDAGKYLRSNGVFQNDETIEFAPKERKRFPMKIAAPVAAAAVLAVGITIALKTTNRSNEKPYLGNDSANAYISDGNTVTDPDDDRNKAPTGVLPFSLFGPDMENIKYEEISGVAHNITLQQLSTANWIAISCDGFAYIAKPNGENHNSAVNAELFPISDNEEKFFETKFSRIYVGEKYGGLTVKNASCEFRRTPTNGITNEQLDKGSFETSRLFQYSYVEFSGETDLTGYIVRDNAGDYWFVPGEGETRLPLMSFAPSGEKSFNAIKAEIGIGEFDYFGELPRLPVSDKLKPALDAFFEDTSVQRADVRLSDISICYDAQETENFRVIADITDVLLLNWSDEPNNGSAEAADIINSAETVGELYLKTADITKLNKVFDHFKVYFDFKTANGINTVQITDESQNLVAGMRVCIFDRENKLRCTCYYRQDP